MAFDIMKLQNGSDVRGVALEGVEIARAHLGGAVAAPEVVLEEDGHLLHHGLARACAAHSRGCLERPYVAHGA